MDFTHKGLGWHPGPEDQRDEPLKGALERLGAQKTSGSQFWYGPLPVLDQGREGACVGFSWTQMVNAAPQIRHWTDEDALRTYRRARELDEWPGEDYDGTSVRAGAKASKENGWITSYAFSQRPRDIALWILNRRPVVIGIDWYESMYNARREDHYFIKPEGEVVGGHAIVVDGIRYQEGGKGSDYVRLRNSWGPEYGYLGRAKMKFSVFAQMMSDPNAIAATATEL